MWEEGLSQFLKDVWGGVSNAGVELGEELVRVLPGIIAAVIILIVGWIVAVIVAKVVRKGLDKIKLDLMLKEKGLEKALGGASLSQILSTLAKWYTFIIFLNQVVQLIALSALQEFLSEVLVYLPSLFGAAIVLILGLIVGEYVKISIRELQIPYYDIVGSVAKFLVFYVSLVIGLETAGFDASILVYAFNIGLLGIVLTVSITAGIGFGLAVKDEARKLVKNIKKKI